MNNESPASKPQSLVESGTPVTPPEQMQLLVEMYKSLRAEISTTMKENAQLVIYGILATGALPYFALTLPRAAYPEKLILAIPPLLAYLFRRRALWLRDHIDVISNHVALIERDAGLCRETNGSSQLQLKSRLLGWDCYWTVRRGAKDGSPLNNWLSDFWWVIIAVNVICAVVLMWK